MAKYVINPNKKLSKINKRSTDIFPSTWAAASMRASMWERILRFPTATECVWMW